MKRLEPAGFAVFGAIVIAAAAIASPVTAKASGQVDILDKYGKYIKAIESIEKKIGDIRNKLISHFDSCKGLKIEERLKYLREKLEEAKSEDDLKKVAREFADTLRGIPAFRMVENTIRAKCQSEFSLLIEMTEKLNKNPQDITALHNALLKELCKKI